MFANILSLVVWALLIQDPRGGSGIPCSPHFNVGGDIGGGADFFPHPTAASDMRGDSNIEMGGKGDSVPTFCQDSPSGETPKGSERKKMYSRLFLPGMDSVVSE